MMRKPERTTNQTWWIAGAATAVSLGLAITPGVIGRLRGAEVSYDASIAVLTATLISIIWYTAFTYESVVHQKSRDEQELLRARMSLATGAIAELRWLEGLLYQVIELGPLSFYDPFGHPVLKAALRQATLFKPKTVGLLADFHSLLRDVQASVNEFRSDPQRVASKKAMYICSAPGSLDKSLA